MKSASNPDAFWACMIALFTGARINAAIILGDLTENQRRLYLRREMAEHNKQLVETAKNAGVETQLCCL